VPLSDVEDIGLDVVGTARPMSDQRETEIVPIATGCPGDGDLLYPLESNVFPPGRPPDFNP
jgi:hypothetical protein